MKKITLFLFAMMISVGLFSQTYKWQGTQTDQIWDYGTANWLNPALAFPLNQIPTTFTDGVSAIFDDTSTEGSDTIKITGTITVDSVLVNASKTYVLRSTATTTDELTGTGRFIKDGEGLLVMDLKNTMAGGTLLKKGIMKMEKQTTANIFGSKIVFQGGTANFATTSSGSFPSISLPLEIPQGVTAKVELSRYSYFASPISGDGDLVMSVGGERTMLGTNKAGGVAVDWSNFTGNVFVEPYVMSGVTPGYYGIVLPSTKTWDYTNFETVDSLFWNKKVTINGGAGLASVSGVRCWAIGELQAENDECFLGGYGAGKSQTPRVYYMIGTMNTDVVCPITMKDTGGGGYNYFGILKVGTGKYVFTSTKSNTTAFTGVEVFGGTFLVDVPVSEDVTGLGVVKQGNVMTIHSGAIGGGNGRLTGRLEVDGGTLVIGNDKVGEIVLGDITGGTYGSPLVVKNEGKVEFKLSTATSYDKLSTNNTATFGGNKIIVKPAAAYDIKNDDVFTLVTTANRKVAGDTCIVEFAGFPETLSFVVSQDTIVGAGYQIQVKAVGSAKFGETKVSDVYFNNVNVFPIPSTGILNVESKDADINAIEIINLQGQVVLTDKVSSRNVQLNIENLSKGIYFARIHSGNKISTKKIVLK
ncbi:MAG: T9SS type A sorting domain-containing protein [Paludibacter sp.]|nr:T9SS type A sorting domain-containing protein [Paludibacter sp.]